jgi:hypothetical protein
VAARNILGTIYEYCSQYDGEGRRVKKDTWRKGSPDVLESTTEYAYNGAGQLAAEYTNQVQSGSGLLYLMTDALGTTRLEMGATGNRRRDYMPFGEELGAPHGRTTALG